MSVDGTVIGIKTTTEQVRRFARLCKWLLSLVESKSSEIQRILTGTGALVVVVVVQLI